MDSDYPPKGRYGKRGVSSNTQKSERWTFWPCTSDRRKTNQLGRCNVRVNFAPCGILYTHTCDRIQARKLPPPPRKEVFQGCSDQPVPTYPVESRSHRVIVSAIPAKYPTSDSQKPSGLSQYSVRYSSISTTYWFLSF